MSTIRETIETSFAATAFAEQNLSADATFLMQELRPESRKRAETVSKAEKRPRPTLQAK